MANWHKTSRSKVPPLPPQRACRNHPNVPAAPNRDLCVNCAAYHDMAAAERPEIVTDKR